MVKIFKNKLAKASTVKEVAAKNEALQDENERLKVKADDTLGVVERQSLTIKGLEADVAEAPYRAREELVGEYGIRIGWKEFDLQKIQAQVRVVEPSIRIEREGFRWVLFSGRKLDEAQMRRLESKLGFKLERG